MEGGGYEGDRKHPCFWIHKNQNTYGLDWMMLKSGYTFIYLYANNLLNCGIIYLLYNFYMVKEY